MTTYLLRANERGEILDAEGRVVGKVVPVEPTIAMLVDAVKVRHGDATYRCVSATGCATFEREASDDYTAMLSAATLDLSAVAVKVPRSIQCGEFEHARLVDRAEGWNACLDALGVK